MPSNYTINGVDLDTIFKARSSTKRADIGIKVGDVDISNRYEPTNGSDQITTNTDIKTNNTDLRYVFQSYSYAPAPIFNDVIKFGIQQYNGDCWRFRLYTTSGSAQRFKVNTELGSFYFAGNYAPAWVDQYINTGKNKLDIYSIEAVDSNNAALYYWDVQLNFNTNSNINNATTAAFTVTQNATTTPKVAISSIGQSYGYNLAQWYADFAVTI